MLYLFFLLAIITSSVQATEESVVTLWAPHEVLLKPDADNLPLPKCVTPKAFETELIEKISLSTTYMNTAAAKHHSKLLPLGLRAWLLDLETGDRLTTLAREKISMVWNPLLYLVAGIAFSPDAASKLKPIAEVEALVKACPQQKVIASNWNSESFAEIEKRHAGTISLFERRYTSGQPGQPGSSTKLNALTSEPAFFEAIKRELGDDKTYYYIDIAEGTESLAAAETAGITPITVPVAHDKEKALALKVQLVKYGLLPE